MIGNRKDARSKEDSPFVHQVAVESARKLRVLRDGQQGVWFGLGMAGLIGWSVAVPTIGGALFGLWWDRHHPGGHSWTLALLAVGLVLGCANAWHWVADQDRAMHDTTGDSRDGNDE
jgi:ATP synthase protein I